MVAPGGAGGDRGVGSATLFERRAPPGSGTGAEPAWGDRTGKVPWHFGHRTFSPPGGTRRSSMLYSELQVGQVTRTRKSPVLLGAYHPDEQPSNIWSTHRAHGSVQDPSGVPLPSSETDLLILGGGLAGLSTALHAPGSYRLVERAERVG